MGKNELRLLKFALRYPESWHGYGTDRSTVAAVRSLESKGLIERNEFRQFRAAMQRYDKRTWVRFECGQEDRMSEEFGPYEFTQMTYEALRAGLDGEEYLAHYTNDRWKTADGQDWTDVVIFSR